MLNQKCSNCGESAMPANATFCPSCGKSIELANMPSRTAPTFTLKTEVADNLTLSLPMILGLIGSVILFIGVFTPIITLPIVGSMNYFQNGRGDGVIILLVAVLSAFLTLAKGYRFLMLTGGGSIAILALTFIKFQVRMSQMQAEMEKSLANNPFAGLGGAMMNTVQISWGWAVLIIGAVLLIAAAVVHRQNSPNETDQSSVFLSFADKQVYIAIAAVFIVWIGLLGYGFVSDGSTAPPANSSAIAQAKTTSSSSSSSTTSESISREERAYLTSVGIGKIEVGKTILDEPGVFGELKNNGDKTLDQIDITIYFLDKHGNPVYEKSYSPVYASVRNYGMSDTSALKPKYSRKFGYKADDAPSDWAKKVNVRVTQVHFAK